MTGGTSSAMLGLHLLLEFLHVLSQESKLALDLNETIPGLSHPVVIGQTNVIVGPLLQAHAPTNACDGNKQYREMATEPSPLLVAIHLMPWSWLDALASLALVPRRTGPIAEII